jgi:hypothetical protein
LRPDFLETAEHEALLDDLQRGALRYFLHETHPVTGLVADNTAPGSPSSIAASGMALGALPIAVERHLLLRADAAARTLRLLRFFRDSAQTERSESTGFKGFFYHFLDMDTGRRVWQCELSTIDTALLVAGSMVSASYFDGQATEEQEIRAIAELLYQRVDWEWALDGGRTLTHGWRPESGFLPFRWRGYDEALILYVLALGSPTHPISPDSYSEWLRTHTWKRVYGRELLYSGPLFTHQYSHMWLDLRGIRDACVREKGIDYFGNSRQATLVQQEYAIRNPLGFKGYCDCCWGFTACHGPPPGTVVVDGVERQFLGYSARGAPYGPDDGTIAPWAAVASLPFAPDVVLPTIRHFNDMRVGASSPYGFESTFNPTYPDTASEALGWVCPLVYGIDQGALALMIENYRTGLIWKLMREVVPIRTGLERAGFEGGWLASE